jgi:hypothetical protein
MPTLSDGMAKPGSISGYRSALKPVMTRDLESHRIPMREITQNDENKQRKY